MYIYIYIYICTYIYIERERENKQYIYIYIYTYRLRLALTSEASFARWGQLPHLLSPPLARDSGEGKGGNRPQPHPQNPENTGTITICLRAHQ